MPIYAFESHRPVIAATAYIAPSAQIIGKVTIGELDLARRYAEGAMVEITPT